MFLFFIMFLNLNSFILIGGWLLYNIVLVLPHINMNLPQAYTCSPSWTPLLPPSPHHPSGSSQCTSPEHPASCIESGLAIRFTYNIHVSFVSYHIWNELLVQVQCMIQDAWGWCTGMILCFFLVYFCPDFYDFFPSINPGVLHFFFLELL